MKQLQGSGVLFAGAALVLLAAQPVWSQAAKVTAVQLNPTDTGFNLVLETAGNTSGKDSVQRSQVFTSRRGKTLVADIINAQLSLAQGKFRQDNPAPGVAAVEVSQLDSNSVRLVVTGTTSAPSGQIAQRNGQGITLSIGSAGTTAAAPANSPRRNAPAATPTPTQPRTGQTAQKPLVPNPEVTIDRNQAPTASPVPPTLPRAIAPPVGDIAVSNSDSSPNAIDLDTAERVPRLVLRDAPAREVLSLLARAANLNLAFTTAPPPGGQQQGQPAPSADTPADEGPTLSLDIQDESVQDVFNYVLRISGLQANRTGRTIFVGPRLPNEARDLVVRSFRLNQIGVAEALNFLVAMGAESAVSRDRQITSVNAVPVGGAAAPATQTQTSTETRIETQRIDFQDAVPLLRGLQIVGDERTNSVTLIGSPKQIDIAAAQIVQLDARRRQVSVNIKIVDINLLATEDFNTSFSFGIGDTFFQNDAGADGAAILNFGTTNPQSVSGSVNPPGFSRRFLARLQALVSSGNAKILTDPTLTVQEGQTAQVNLTQEVPAGLNTRYENVGGGNNSDVIAIQEVETKDAGLTVLLRVERIDDNGFISLSVAPTVSSIARELNLGGGNRIAFLNERNLSSGLIRLRDGQTLILSGIIQDSDQTTVNKVPILGDIPLLGALFRSTNRNNQRQEVIVMLTPQILDDSERSSSQGYNYTPSPEVRQMLERQGVRVPGNNPQR